MPKRRITQLDRKSGALWVVESVAGNSGKRARWDIVAVFYSQREAAECMSMMVEGPEPVARRLQLTER